jgi:hypothetical protein
MHLGRATHGAVAERHREKKEFKKKENKSLKHNN